MSRSKFAELLITMKEQYESAVSSGAKVIFMDEAVFSPNTMLLRSWAPRNRSIEVEDLRHRLTTQAVIAGISVEQGLESYMIKERSFNQESYMEFLR